MEDWRLIPDILSLVLEKLPSLMDYLQFSVVCKSWHNVALSKNIQQVFLKTSHCQLPLLLIPTREGSKQRHLCSIGKNKTLDFKVSVPYNQRSCGSSQGWLLFNSKTCLTMLNPFTGKIIELPPIGLGVDVIIREEEEEKYFYSEHVQKATLSCDLILNCENYEVLAIYGDSYRLAIFKAGHENWTTIEDGPHTSFFNSVIYHKDAFHAIDALMGLYKISAITTPKRKMECSARADMVMEITKNDILGRSYKLDTISPRYVPQFHEDVMYYLTSRLFYLAESSEGDLICIIRNVDTTMGDDGEELEEELMYTASFRVLKLVDANLNDQKKWVEIDNIHKDALFIGNNDSIAINVSKNLSYQKNSIYYADDDFPYERDCPLEVGIFNLEDQDFRFHKLMNSSPDALLQAVWIEPSLVVLSGGEPY